MSELVIRPATAEDAEALYTLICELADYEKMRDQVVATVETVRTSIFSPGACSEALLAELAGEQVGFAVYFATYSTFLGKEGIYLEDVYVRPAFRGKGIGKRLLAEVARLAVERGEGRLEWSVLDWNKPSIDFYDNLGAKPLNEWIKYRITGAELRELAAQVPDA